MIKIELDNTAIGRWIIENWWEVDMWIIGGIAIIFLILFIGSWRNSKCVVKKGGKVK